jgi:hypothetical protein
MAKFDSSRIDKLEYDFTTPEDFRPRDKRDDDGNVIPVDDLPGNWKGVVPEPTEDMLLEFFGTFSDLQLEAGAAEETYVRQMDAEARDVWRAQHPAADPITDDDLDVKLLQDRTIADVRTRMAGLIHVRQQARSARAARLNEAVAAFTQGYPGVDVLEALPFRVVDGFVGWLTGHFSPEALAAATKL